MEFTPINTWESTLVFCCSGAADVGEIAHQAARRLDELGHATRFCLAGIGGRVPAHLQKSRRARTVLVIDGCHVSCGRRTLEAAGLDPFLHLRVNDLGLAKGQSPVSEAHVQCTVQAALAALANPAPRSTPLDRQQENPCAPA